jgi:hypothetical protein
MSGKKLIGSLFCKRGEVVKDWRKKLLDGMGQVIHVKL